MTNSTSHKGLPSKETFHITSIRVRMVLTVLSTLLFIYIITFWTFFVNFRNSSTRNAQELTHTLAKEYAGRVRADLNVDMDFARSMAQTFAAYHFTAKANRKETHKAILKAIAENSRRFSVGN